MADELTREQKSYNWPRFQLRRKQKFGCSCCRKYKNLRLHRWYSKKRAKSALRRRLRSLQKNHENQ